MAKGNSKEAQYGRLLQAMGIYQPAFEAEIHQLCILERELARTMKAWKATAPEGVSPSPLDPHYALITQQRRDILAHRDALGLTPKGFRRLQRAGAADQANVGVQTASPVVKDLLDAMRAQAAINADVSNLDTGGGDG